MSDQIQIVFIIFTGLIFVSVLIQLIFIAAMSIAMLKMRKKVSLLIDDLRAQGLPLMKTTRGMVDEYSPKLRIAVGNLVETTSRVRDTTRDVASTVQELIEQTRGYATRTDRAVSGTLDRISRASNSVQQKVSGPIRQVNGVFNALRAGLSVICSRQPPTPNGSARRNADTSPQEPEIRTGNSTSPRSPLG